MRVSDVSMMTEEFRQALRRLAKAVVILTSQMDGRRYAIAATAVCEVSLDPPSMLACVNRTTSIFPALAAGMPFGINILHHSQVDIAHRCAGLVKGEERFLTGDWTEGPLGVPLLTGAQAALGCRSVKVVEHGTHGIFIGDVLEVVVDACAEPLIHVDGHFANIGVRIPN